MTRIKISLVALLALVCMACIVPQLAFAASGSSPQTLAPSAVNVQEPDSSTEQASPDTTAATTDTTITTKTKKKLTAPKLKYRVCVKGKGWAKKWTKSGKVAGTLNHNNRLEGLRVFFKSGGREGTLQYRVCRSGERWSKWGDVSSTARKIAKTRGISDIQLRLTGELADTYEVLYRTHMSGVGWDPWVVGPTLSGWVDKRNRIDALSIKLVKKNSKSAALKKARANSKKVTKAHKKFDNRLERAEEKAAGISSSTDYLITVDCSNHWLCVFEGGDGEWEMIDDWQVSNGRHGSPTVKGQFTVQDKGYSFGHGYTCYYYTQFYGDYLFHSVLYHEGTFKIKDGRLGRYISAGCVRMPIDRARWIQNNIPQGSKVYIYS